MFFICIIAVGVRIVIRFAVAMIILSFLCTGIRAVNQEDSDSKEVPEMP